MKKTLRSPVLFLAYKRPELVVKVFARIREAAPIKLYVALDGPKSNADSILIEQVKSIVKQVDWPCEVKYLFRKNNLGCRLAISSAIDWFFTNETEGIILEDDCLPNQSFFYFCQEMLDRYRNDQRISMISGTNYLLKHPKIKSDYFYSKHSVVWGWATWKDRWQKYDLELKKWPELKQQKQLNHLVNNYFAKKYLALSFDSILAKEIDTWDIQWMFTCLFNNTLSIIPKVNLVSNLGVNGVHANRITNAHFYPVFDLDDGNLKGPDCVTPDFYFDSKLDHDKSFETVLRMFFYSRLRRSFFYRFYKKS